MKGVSRDPLRAVDLVKMTRMGRHGTRDGRTVALLAYDERAPRRLADALRERSSSHHDCVISQHPGIATSSQRGRRRLAGVGEHSSRRLKAKTHMPAAIRSTPETLSSITAHRQTHPSTRPRREHGGSGFACATSSALKRRPENRSASPVSRVEPQHFVLLLERRNLEA